MVEAQATWWTLPAPCSRRSCGRLVVDVEAAAARAARLPAAARRPARTRAPRAGARAGLGRGAVGATAWKPCRASSAGTSGWSAISGASGTSTTSELVVEALGVGEAQAAPVPLGLDRRWRRAAPPRNRATSCEATRQTIRCTIAGARPPRRRAGVLEEGQVGAGVALLVGEEEVVDGRVVLVDGFLDQAQAHAPRRRSRRCAARPR